MSCVTLGVEIKYSVYMDGMGWRGVWDEKEWTRLSRIRASLLRRECAHVCKSGSGPVDNFAWQKVSKRQGFWNPFQLSHDWIGNVKMFVSLGDVFCLATDVITPFYCFHLYLRDIHMYLRNKVTNLQRPSLIEELRYVTIY